MTENESSSETPKSSPEDIVTNISKETMTRILQQSGNPGIFVIYSKRNNSCAFDRATQHIVANSNRKIVELYLKRMKKQNPREDGVIMTHKEALKLFFKHQKHS